MSRLWRDLQRPKNGLSPAKRAPADRAAMPPATVWCRDFPERAGFYV